MCRFALLTLFVVISCSFAPAAEGARQLNADEPRHRLTGTVVDSETGHPIAARIYLRDADGNWMFVESSDPDGSAVIYDEQWVPMPDSVDRHTTISAHPFQVDLEPGVYRITIERGKEYRSLTRRIEVKADDINQEFQLQRWVDCSARGWYSGETHVHRRVHELRNVMLAEDLNVAFPVTFWTVNANEAPGLSPSPLRRQGPSPHGPRIDHGVTPIDVDATHVIVPRNTEFEVFNVDGERHVLGAMFVLNHKSIFDVGAPPVRDIAKQAHDEGALIDLDKHSWPWSMMLVPVAEVDLFELSNNSLWRTEFGFRNSGVPIGDHMVVEREGNALTEWGWIQFGFESYYTLLNCGFRLRPTAGTASGVHPVPLGFGRVYVHVEGEFTLEKWLAGFDQGQSFVTTGPMLFATLDEQLPGHIFQPASQDASTLTLSLESVSDEPVDRIEIIVNGEIAKSIKIDPDEAGPNDKSPSASLQFQIDLDLDESSWVAVRSIQTLEDNRVRFAHTAPWHIEIDQEPVRPKRAEVAYLIEAMRREISRNREILPEESLREFRDALEIYEEIMKRAR